MFVRYKERGQSLVILALVMVGLLAIAAIAIDGGSIFAERRRAQTAADNAALAAAYAFTKKGDYVTAGQNQAMINGYENNGSDPNVEILYPPVDGQYAGNNEYIQVRITSSIKPVFSHFIFGGQLKNTVEAVVKIRQGGPYQLGNAIIATNKTACNALYFTGSGTIRIDGGGAYSNSIAGLGQGSSCSPSCCSGYSSGDSELNLVEVDSAGKITTIGEWDALKPANVNAIIEENGGTTYQMDYSEPPAPDCSKLPQITGQLQINKAGVTTINSGNYQGGIKISNSKAELVMTKGLYCIGGDFEAPGGKVTGNEIMIYQYGGSIKFNGATFNLTPANENTTWQYIEASDWKGMIIFMPYSNKGQIELVGNSDTNLVGTILALGPVDKVNQYKCIINGTSKIESIYSTQVVCDTVNVIGTGTVNINYDVNEIFIAPGLIDIMK